MKVVTKMAQPLNPLWVIRAAGPAGRWLVGKARADLSRKYLKYIPDAETLVSEYIYQCNSQTPRYFFCKVYIHNKEISCISLHIALTFTALL